MNGRTYHRLRELEKVLKLHFSDLGDIIDFQFDFKDIFIHEPMWATFNKEPLPTMVPYDKGSLFTIQVKFKPKKDIHF